MSSSLSFSLMKEEQEDDEHKKYIEINKCLLRQIGCLKKENETIRQELKGTHTASRTIYDGKIKEIYELGKEKNELFKEFTLEQESWRGIYQSLNRDKETLISEVAALRTSEKEWIGRTIKFQYLFEQMGRVGLQQSEDIFECFNDIDVPEISLAVKDEFVTTTNTGNIDFVDEEDDLDYQLSDWMSPRPGETIEEYLIYMGFSRTIALQRARMLEENMVTSVEGIHAFFRGSLGNLDMLSSDSFRNELQEEYLIYMASRSHTRSRSSTIVGNI